MNCEFATCLDGPRFAAFIDERRADRRALTAADRRALQRWRQGDQVRYQTADRLLLRLGLDLHDVPDECWRRYCNGRSGWRKQAA